MNLKFNEHNQDTTALEVQIDQMVYELYRLSEEEVVVVEENKILDYQTLTQDDMTTPKEVL